MNRSLNTSSLRLPLVLAAGAAACVGALGLTQTVLFSQPGTVKYAVTALGPLAVAGLLLAPRPLRLLVPLAVVLAPFGQYGPTFGAMQVPVLTAVLAVGVVIAVAEGPEAARPTRTGLAAAAGAALLLVPLLLGTQVGEHAMLVATIGAAGWLTARVASDRDGRLLVMGALVVAAAIQGALAVWQLKTGEQLNLYGSAGSGTFAPDYFFSFGDEFRPTGSLFDPISLGNLLAVACPVAVALALAARRPWERFAAVGLGFLVLIGLVVSLSRMSWLAAAVGTLLAIALLPPRRRLMPAVAVVGLAAAALALAPSTGGDLERRFTSILNPTSAQNETGEGDRSRVGLWGAAADTFTHNPVVGVGIGGLREELAERVAGVGESTHAHSTYLQIAAEAGLLGALGLLAVLIAAARDLAEGVRRDRLLAAGVAGALVATLVCWATDFTIRYPPVAAVFAVLFGLAASFALQRREERGGT